MVVDRQSGTHAHKMIRDLPELLPSGALLVANDTKVIPARLHGTKPTGGRVELLLVERLRIEGDAEIWQCIGGASKPIRLGPIALHGDRAPAAEVLGVKGELVEVRFVPHGESLLEALDRIGQVPLPPYIKRESQREDDRARYQTVFAREPGAVAAPTAGLHFTESLLERLRSRGIERTDVTLHVGPGTFAPLRADELEGQELHEEIYRISESTAQTINRARKEGRKIVAVGTTVVRTLESAASESGQVSAVASGRTKLFIQPGYTFRVVDQMVTNFHLPRSSLLMLVSAFGGKDAVLAAYNEAVRQEYRFFSYGDAMLIR